MAEYQQHIDQSKKNFRILQDVNAKIPDSLDWQITICFYTALHLIDAYLAKEAGMHYQKHTEVREAIWYENKMSPYRIEDDRLCLSYRSLENLSRRSRYLCHDDASLRYKEAGQQHLINDKHLAKAVRLLDYIIGYFNSKYNLSFMGIKIVCKELPLIGGNMKFVNQKNIILDLV